MSQSWRYAHLEDVPLLAEWNHQLIRDEGHRNPMTVPQLEERLRVWLGGEYRAVVFSEDGADWGYALFREQSDSIHLRQMFVRRDLRRRGLGRAGFAILKDQIWPKNVRLTVDVLVRNTVAAAFWRSVGYKDYCLTLEMESS